MSSTPKTLAAANALVERLAQKLGRARVVQSELSQKATARAEQKKVHETAMAEVAAANESEALARKNQEGRDGEEDQAEEEGKAVRAVPARANARQPGVGRILVCVIDQTILGRDVGNGAMSG